jgi:LPXTG-site transpeptidase (sortase) family protein
MDRQEQIRFLVLHTLGNFLVLFSLYGVAATFGPFLGEQMKYTIMQARGVTFRVAEASCQFSDVSCQYTGNQSSGNQTNREPANMQPTTANGEQRTEESVSFTDILAGSKEQVLTPQDAEFSILIPKIGASSKVIANVDPENKDAYNEKLKEGVAHAKGSVFPGFAGNTYLFAHSADNWWDVGHYNAVFYTLNNLSETDEIVVFFENRRYNYVVTKKFITNPEDVSYLVQDHTGPNRLVLQTCWPPGTTLQRLFVIAEPK